MIDNSDYKIKVKKLIEKNLLLDPIKKEILSFDNKAKSDLINSEFDKINSNINEFEVLDNNFGFISFSKKPWESSIFNLEFASIYCIYLENPNKKLIQNLLKKFISWVKTENVDFCSFRTSNLSSDLKINNLIDECLLEIGFYNVESYSVFINDLSSDNNYDIEGLSLFSEKNSDSEIVISQIKQIAESSFSMDRLHSDKNLDHELAGKSRSEWIANIAKGRGKIIYYGDKKSTFGFLGFKDIIINSNVKYSVIELIAADKEVHGKGVGSKLVHFYIKYLKNNNYNFSIVGTQSKNIGAIRLYEKLGYKAVSCSNTYHLYLGN